jgi:hypothetical protein
METFFAVIISGMAVAFLLSLVESLGGSFISSKVLRLVITWPLSFVAVLFMGIMDPFVFVVASTAAAFFSLTILRVVEKLLDKPTIVDRRRL